MIDKNEDENGRIPRSIECELVEDLTGVCVPGDSVTICGIVKALTVDTTNSSGSGGGGGPRSNRDKCTFVLYISTNSVVSNKQKHENSQANFTAKDMQAFKEIQSEPDIFK
jgi:DNA helicase MCM8